MTGEHKENFQNLREMLRQVAAEMDCNIVPDRSNRAHSVYFELIPNGCAYGPRVRINDAQMRDGRYMDKFIEEQPEVLRLAIKQRLALQKEMEEEG
jgi:hypothetical protein